MRFVIDKGIAIRHNGLVQLLIKVIIYRVMFIFRGRNLRRTNEKIAFPSKAWEIVAIFSACSFGVPAIDLISGWKVRGGLTPDTNG